MSKILHAGSRASSVYNKRRTSVTSISSASRRSSNATTYNLTEKAIEEEADDIGVHSKLSDGAGGGEGYGTILSQFIEAREDSASYCELVDRTGDIINSSVAVTVICGICVSLPMAMICIGVQYLQECPKQPKIPIYLLVGGCFGVLKLLALIWKQYKARRLERMDQMYEAEDDETEDPVMSRSSKFTDGILTIFLFVWFILGNVWVLGIWKPRFEQTMMEPDNWCDETVYMFTFVQIIIVYAMILLAVVVLLGLYICHRCGRKG